MRVPRINVERAEVTTIEAHCTLYNTEIFFIRYSVNGKPRQMEQNSNLSRAVVLSSVGACCGFCRSRTP
jgi:hypothetical protein